MSATKAAARRAGALYLLTAILAPFNLIYIPNTLFVRGNASATAQNLAAHEGLFRLGIFSGLVSEVIFLFVVLALYRLFKDVDRNQAKLMLVLVLVSVAMGFMNGLNEIGALVVVRGGDVLAAFDKPQRDALVMLFLRLRGQEILVAEILWGLWLLPLAALVHRSRILPRFLGVWLALNGAAYLALSFAGLLLPQYEGAVSKLTFPALFGELALMLWLLVLGVKPRTGETPSAPA